MNEKIKQYYRERLLSVSDDSLLFQVGKTVNGKEVSTDQVKLIIKTIKNKLQLNKNDFVLDIGSGNGLLTREISNDVSQVIGLELTYELYEVARKLKFHDNIIYINCNILYFDTMKYKKKFSKVYLYEVMQHFNYKEADILFAKLNEVTKEDAVVFLGGVLDAEKKWIFFDTVDRRCGYFTELLSEHDTLGVWYHKDFFRCLARRHGFRDILYLVQEKELYTSHYRFDCLLRKEK